MAEPFHNERSVRKVALLYFNVAVVCCTWNFITFGVCMYRASLMKRSRSTRDRERKDRIKVDLDEIRNMLPKSATDKKLVSIDCSVELNSIIYHSGTV